MRRLLLFLVAAFSPITSSSQSPPTEVAGPVGAVEATGAPRSYISARIPIATPATSIKAVPAGSFTLVGPKTQSLSPNDSAYLLSLGIPANAKSGRQLAAWVYLTRPSRPTSDSLAVYVTVTSFYKVSLFSPQKLVPAAAGQLVSLLFTLHNRGNSPDTVPLRFFAPADWPPKNPVPTSIILLPGQLDTLLVQLKVPYEAASGAAEIHLGVVATPARTPVPDAVVSVSVVNPITAKSEGITADISALTIPGTRAHALGLFAHGYVASDVFLTSRITRSRQESYIDDRLFGRAGYYNSPWYILLNHPNATASLGLSTLSLSSLTGYSVSASGAAASFSKDSSQGGLIVGRSAFAEGPDKSRYLAGYYGKNVGAHGLRTNIAILDEHSIYAPRKLNAISFSDSYRPTKHLELFGEAALRQSRGHNVSGYATSVQYQDLRSLYGLKYTSAPGGNESFSRADQEIVGFAARSFRSLSLGANGWYSRDSSALFPGLISQGASFAPSWSLNKYLSLRLSATYINYQAKTLLGEFGTETQNYSTGLNLATRSWSGSVAYEQGLSAHTAKTDFLEQSVNTRLPTRAFLASLSRPIWRGQFQASHSLSRLTDAVGQQTDQNFSSVSFSGLRPFSGLKLNRVELALAADRQAVSFPEIDWLSARLAILSPLTSSLSIGLHAEYSNQIVEYASQFGPPLPSASPIRFAVKMQYALHVPFYRDTRSVHGVVYSPKTSSSPRRPLAGAIVRQGPTSTITDKKGRYRLGPPAAGPVYLDPRSLPPGALAPATSKTASSLTRQDFVVSPTGRLIVKLASLGSREGRFLKSPLGGLTIYATDSAQTAWSASVDKDSVAIFDALPPGPYVISIDLQTLPEPAVMVASSPSIIMSSDDQNISLAVAPRPLRVLFEGQQSSPPPAEIIKKNNK